MMIISHAHSQSKKMKNFQIKSVNPHKTFSKLPPLFCQSKNISFQLFCFPQWHLFLRAETYSAAGKIYLHQQAEIRKNMPSSLIFLIYRD
jgi:hypothetical protein